jgi:hypothetical protein
MLWIAAQQRLGATKEFAMPGLCLPCGFAADNFTRASDESLRQLGQRFLSADRITLFS